MASRFLPAVIENALHQNRALRRVLVRGAGRSRHILTFCDNFRVAGIGSLFLTGTSEPFLHNLHQSGRAFAHYLRNAGNADVRLSLSRPFFDAVGVGDFDGAALIARHARRSWAQGEEYEEDFLFIEFLIQHGVLAAPVSACEDLLARYERVLSGAEDLRLDVCRTLLQADSDAFNQALALFLSDRKDRLEAQAETTPFPEEFLATEWNFSLEGLALARLAERNGLETEEDYLHIPSLARAPDRTRPGDDSWMEVD
ncbi:Imm49 family immunity protein [Myxococcus sp. MxC21-1]|uniref:Imm49 family immunity protein n=1 Tax=Myxococcus sp. MxC21-1 TaxID=3041439 RepID=UPI00293060C0|nr:Imm49 family immunity protein [Myxococcus sp. MxC21-1]WNZ62050.1 Imm49 family immunity protein [Myxococcus sp. MxC21-1]